jgi:hypothetical protein
MNIFLNTFTPISINKIGRNNSKKHNIPPFIDGSCRREPDFQNEMPSITQLCRPGKLVPRLKVGDLVIYLTRLGSYDKSVAHWNFVGILQVIDIVDDHTNAEVYYQKNNLPVSNNIMCNSTCPFPLDMTHESHPNKDKILSEEQIIELWNKSYNYRANKYRKVAITKVWENKLFIDNPPTITREMMNEIFNRIPITQNPPKLRDDEWERFRTIMNI